MKKFAYWMLGIGGVLLLVLFAALATVDVNRFKPQIIAQAEKALGRNVTLEGEIALRLFPTIALKIQGLRIENPSWAGGGDMLSAPSITLGAELMPLFHGQLNITSLEILNPHIQVIKKDGSLNWKIEAPKSSTAPKRATSSSANSRQSISFKHIYVSDATITYRDLKTGESQTIDALSLNLSSPDLTQEIQAELNAKLKGDEIGVKAKITQPFGLFEKIKTPIEASVTAKKTTLIFQGFITNDTVPAIEGSLRAKEIDLTPFSTAQASQKSVSGQAVGDSPFDFSSLNALRLDINIAIDSLTFKQMVITPLKSHITLNHGSLNLAISDTKIYGGVVTAVANLNANGALKFSGNLANLNAEPLLIDWANNRSITGILSSRFNLGTSFSNAAAAINTLQGTANFHLHSGAIKGKNLAAAIRQLKSLGGNAGGNIEQTDFSEITGSTLIKNGIVRNDDLFMKSPLIRLHGEGEVNLPRRLISYTLKPEIVGTLKGQGGKNDAAGLTVPIKISGSLDNPVYALDAKAALIDNLTPEKIGALKGNVKSIKEQLKNGGGLDNLKGLFGR